MTKQDFITLGLTDEQAEAVTEAVKKELSAYTPKSDYDAKLSELTAANKSIKELTEKLKAFDGADISGLKKSINDWEEKYNNDISSLRKNHAVDMAIIQARGKNPKAVKALIDMEKISLKDDGMLEGLDIESLKKTDSYLFDIDEMKIEGTGTPKSGGEKTGGIADSFIAAARNAAGLK